MRTGPSTRSSRRRDRRRIGSRASATTTSSKSRRPASRAATARWCASVTPMPASVGSLSSSTRLQCQICCVQKSGSAVYLHMPFTPVPHTFLTAALQRRTNLVLLTSCHRAHLPSTKFLFSLPAGRLHASAAPRQAGRPDGRDPQLCGGHTFRALGESRNRSNICL